MAARQACERSEHRTRMARCGTVIFMTVATKWHPASRALDTCAAQRPFSLRLGSGPLSLFVRFFFPSNSTKRARSGGRQPGILRSSLNFSPSILGVTLAPLLLGDWINPEGRTHGTWHSEVDYSHTVQRLHASTVSDIACKMLVRFRT
jgi:hypothetical protein